MYPETDLISMQIKIEFEPTDSSDHLAFNASLRSVSMTGHMCEEPGNCTDMAETLYRKVQKPFGVGRGALGADICTMRSSCTALSTI